MEYSPSPTLPPGFELALAGEADADGLIALINLVQPSVPFTPSHLRWQYFGPPAGAPRLYVIREGARIVALYSAVAQRFRVGNSVLPARLIQDAMTHPDYRGRGFLHLLAARCLADMRAAGELGLTFPRAGSQSLRSFTRTGWTDLAAVPARSTAVPPGGGGTGPGIREVSGGYDERATRAWQESGLPVGAERDAEYLNWRCAKEGARYTKFLVEGGAGFLIMKEYRGADRAVAHICELAVRAGSRDLLPGTLAFALRWAAEKGCASLTAWLPAGHPYEVAYEAWGLKLEAPTHRLCVEMPESVRGKLEAFSGWHLSQGDSDVY